jgi:hypothetical protein
MFCLQVQFRDILDSCMTSYITLCDLSEGLRLERPTRSTLSAKESRLSYSLAWFYGGKLTISY